MSEYSDWNELRRRIKTVGPPHMHQCVCAWCELSRELPDVALALLDERDKWRAECIRMRLEASRRASRSSNFPAAHALPDDSLYILVGKGLPCVALDATEAGD